MLMHPEMSLAVAKAKHVDLIREVRPSAGRRRPELRSGGGDPLPSRVAGQAGRLRQALRRVYGGRAAEPAS